MPLLQASSSVCSPLKACLLILVTVVAIYVLGRPLYWHFFEGFGALRHAVGSGSVCPPCACECPLNTTPMLPPDCAEADPMMQDELDKYTADLLSEELKVQVAVAEENQQRADSMLLEAKKLSSQYQKEAEKCNFGMETCEEAREKAEEALREQKKLTEMWEKRAQSLGWKGDD